ncbi:alpha-1,2-fucosyltransferase [Cohnella caldifontis]|uniref:alpha-1,2-fucosyltransferase n=1 Tax=Cohnella caldifontis TaxID=3027471 RepID=UPI0023ECF6FC|nr:alpha-1,2-fucosyltransferase [Cohnella sp. YIM B05605]
MKVDPPRLVTMSCLGKNGFFGNQLFQYAFLKIYAKRYGLYSQNPKWIGEYLFGHRELPVTVKLAPVTDREMKEEDLLDPSFPVYQGKDLKGYFHFFSTRHYQPHKDYFRSLFQPAEHIRGTLDRGMERLRSRGNTIVAIHIRRGDFVKYLKEDWCFIAPSDWYIEWLNGFWRQLDRPVLYIASDEPRKVLNDFRAFNPVTAKDVFDELPIPDIYRKIQPSLHGYVAATDFYPDYHVLRHCDYLAISNSTFSFSASMLNERAVSFHRPHYKSRQLIPFDPWDCYPLQLKG